MTEFSEQIWDMKYRYKDKENNPIDITVEDTWRRVAKGIAINETEIFRSTRYIFQASWAFSTTDGEFVWYSPPNDP